MGILNLLEKDVFKLLEKEHDEVESIFKKFKSLDEEDITERDALFNELKDELKRHITFEETNLFPLIKDKQDKKDKIHDKTLEGLEEHHVIKVLLEELDSLSSNKEKWTAKLKVLEETIEHHTMEEERDIFPISREVLSKEQIETLTQKLQRERENLGKSV